MVAAGVLWFVLFGTNYGAVSGTGQWQKTHHKYCIVGAGPGGIQLGHFFKHANRDYVIYERNERAGSFFEKYPRHRMLISLNKRSVREGRSPEFAFRHDWNSLLDVRPEASRVAPVTERTKLMFPHADTVAQYFRDFAEEQQSHIRYGTTVSSISRPAGPGSNFVLKLAKNTQGLVRSHQRHGTTWQDTCEEIIIATGIFRPHGAATRVDGERYLTGYEDLPEKGSAYEGKNVLVLGIGNAAMETAEELHKYTSELHLFARRRPLPDGSMGIRFAYQTHYVGDIRAGRFGILDTYLLKSLDTFDFNALDDQVRIVLIPCQGKKLCVFEVSKEECADNHCKKNFDTGGQDLHYKLALGNWAKGSGYGERLAAIMQKFAKKEAVSLAEGGDPDAQFVFQISDSNPMSDPSAGEEDSDGLSESALQRDTRRKDMGIVDKVFNATSQSLTVSSRILRKYPKLMDALTPLLAHGSESNVRFPMDAVIRCFGWAMDTSIFDSETVPVKTSHKGKYPTIKHDYESDTVPGLHFAGTLGHSLDFRKSAGGFVHGFRYTARAIFRSLEEKNHKKPWPHTLIPMTAGSHHSHHSVNGVDELVQTFMRRINEASGPYQMYETLGDVALFEVEPKSRHWRARYLEDVPVKHFDEKYKHVPRLFWVFKYNANFSGPKVLSEERVGSTSPFTAELSNFLHPHLYYSGPNSMKPSLRHWLQEDIFTQWDTSEAFGPLARFVAHVAAVATKNPRLEKDGTFRVQQHIDTTGFSALEASLATIELNDELEEEGTQDDVQGDELDRGGRGEAEESEEEPDSSVEHDPVDDKTKDQTEETKEKKPEDQDGEDQTEETEVKKPEDQEYETADDSDVGSSEETEEDKVEHQEPGRSGGGEDRGDDRSSSFVLMRRSPGNDHHNSRHVLRRTQED